MKAPYYGREDMAEEIYKQPNACSAKKQAVTEASWEEEKLGVMRAIMRAKSKCVPEYRRELLKSDYTIVDAFYGGIYWSGGLRTHDVQWANEKDWIGKISRGSNILSC